MNLTKYWAGKPGTITFLFFFNPSEIRIVLANAPASSSYASQRASNTALHHQISCSLLATSLLTSVINA